MCPHVRAHCRHLANTIEPPICGGDAALCQITLTTCYMLPSSIAGLKGSEYLTSCVIHRPMQVELPQSKPHNVKWPLGWELTTLFGNIVI